MFLRPTECVSLIFMEHLLCTRHSSRYLTYKNSFNKKPWRGHPSSLADVKNEAERLGNLPKATQSIRWWNQDLNLGS